MEAKFWHERWSEKEIGFHQAEINRYLRDYWGRLNVAQGETVLVPLCGKSQDMVWLAQQGYSVIGVELSEIAAQEFFEELGIDADVEQRGAFKCYSAHDIEIWVGDFFALKTADLEAVVAVYDRASLVALPPEMRRRYVALLERILPAGIKTLLVTFEYESGAAEGPPFSIPQTAVTELFSPHANIELLDSQDFDLRGVAATEHAFFLTYR